MIKISISLVDNFLSPNPPLTINYINFAGFGERVDKGIE